MPDDKLHGLARQIYIGIVEGAASRDAWVEYPTLSSLAERFDVSISPVRSAVERLVREGYFERTETGRLRLSASFPQDVSPSVGRTVDSPVTPDLCARVRMEIIGRGLRGDTDFIREQPLADRFGVGRTALRSIMNKLAVEGLVELTPRRGWRTSKFDEADLCAFVEVRELLESRALELARPRLDRQMLEAFLAQNEDPNLNPHAPLGNELHDHWIDRSQNRYIVEFFARDATYYRTLFSYATPETKAVAEMARQHCEILRALLAEQWGRADRALRTHIRAQKPIVKSLVEKLADH
ncbi:MAG: GntR family transcriptional regulator [Planctomycetota bacterium]